MRVPVPFGDKWFDFDVEWVSIDTILTWTSIDVPYYEKYDPETGEFSGENDRPSISYPEKWEICLEEKRGDDHYRDVVESVMDWGLVMPFQYSVNPDRSVNPSLPELKFGDGHHRLAACIELGYTEVPMVRVKVLECSPDSGGWRQGQEFMQPAYWKERG